MTEIFIAERIPYCYTVESTLGRIDASYRITRLFNHEPISAVGHDAYWLMSVPFPGEAAMVEDILRYATRG
jgi:hypothetical protein